MGSYMVRLIAMTIMRWSKTLPILAREVTLRRGVLALILVLNLRTFEFFPGGRPIEEVWFVICFAAFACLFPLFKIHSNWKFSRLELYLLLTMVVLAFVPATSALRVFGQPLYYGILAKRSVILLGTWVLLLNAWRRGWFDMLDMERVLIFLVWMITVVYAAMRLFVNPASFPDAPQGFILGFGLDQSFSVPGFLLPFGVLFYTLRGIRTGRLADYLLGLVIFFVATGSSWRTLTLSITGSILFFLFRWRPLDNAILSLARFVAVGALGVGLVQVVRPEAITSVVDHFVQALQVATGGGPGTDPSANVRIIESDAALPYVRANPVLGSGLLSVQWHGGALGVLGVYFSDSDIGLLGIMFSYGLVGLLLGAYQYVFAISAARRLGSGERGALIDGAQGFLLYSFLFSLTTGLFIVGIETTTLFVILLYQASHDRIDRSMSNDFLPQNIGLRLERS
jgi:uncharacterized membrane protein